MEKKIFFKIFTDCRVIKGLSSSLIYDLSRNKFYPLENKFADILLDCNGKSINDIISKYTESISFFLDQFTAADIGFYTNDPSSFPELSMEFKHPSRILTAVIEIENTTNYNIENTIAKLSANGCKSILIILKGNCQIDFSALSKIFSYIYDSFISSVELIVSHRFKPFFVDLAFPNHLRIEKILFYQSPLFLNYINNYKTQIIEIENNDYCAKEVIYPDFFFTNIKMFTEAVNYNLGLNRKISILSDGTVKNFLFHRSKFGHIDEIDIESIIKSQLRVFEMS